MTFLLRRPVVIDPVHLQPEAIVTEEEFDRASADRVGRHPERPAADADAAAVANAVLDARAVADGAGAQEVHRQADEVAERPAGVVDGGSFLRGGGVCEEGARVQEFVHHQLHEFLQLLDGRGPVLGGHPLAALKAAAELQKVSALMKICRQCPFDRREPIDKIL